MIGEGKMMRSLLAAGGAGGGEDAEAPQRLADLNVGTLLSLTDSSEDVRLDIDTMFLLLSGFMLSIGAVRAKNAKNILLVILLDASIAMIMFYFCGWAFAYGGSYGDETLGNKFIGYGGFALHNLPREDWYMFFFQYTACATAINVVSGGLAERTRLIAYVLYIPFVCGWVYPVMAHWTWSNDGWASPALPMDEGRLFGVGLIDFAGCYPVHMMGGICALAGAYIVGPRIGKYGKNGEINEIGGHNASFGILGVFLLWFQWYGVNPGSALAILGNSSVAALAAVNTTISAAAATMTALGVVMLSSYRESGQGTWDLLAAANGTLGGLVAITAGCSVVTPWSSFFIGGSAGILYVYAAKFINDKLKVDDPLEAVAVHCICGVYGPIITAAFAKKEYVADVYGEETAEKSGGGFLMGGNLRMLGAALATCVAVWAWTLANIVPFFLLLKKMNMLRSSEEQEEQGLDNAIHGGFAYDQDSKDDDEKGIAFVALAKAMKALSREHGKMKKRMDGISGLLEESQGMDKKMYDNDEYERNGQSPTRGLSPHMGHSHSPQGRGSSPTGLTPKYQARDNSVDRERGHSSSRINPNKYAHESSSRQVSGQARAHQAVANEVRGHARDSRSRTRNY